MTHTKPTREAIARAMYSTDPARDEYGDEVKFEDAAILTMNTGKAKFLLAHRRADVALTALEPAQAGGDVRERVIELIKVAFEPDETVEKAYQVWKGEHFKYADYWSGVKINNRACELADAILSATPQSGWRPIEEAPKDGTGVLILKDVATVLVCHIARWEDETNEDLPEPELWETGWWSYPLHSVTQEKVDELGDVIGWMPLPQPPKQRGE